MTKWLDDYVTRIIKTFNMREEASKLKDIMLKSNEIDKDRHIFMGLYNKHKDYMIQYKN